MKVDNDTKERIKVALIFGLEVYKIAMGTFLSIFIPHTCDEDVSECNMMSLSNTLLGRAAFGLNAAAFTSICALYAIELSRENFCIKHLDINPDLPDTHLATIAPESLKTKLVAWNDLYWRAASTGMVLTTSNVAVSSVFLANHYESSNTITTLLSFSILVFMKLLRSYSMAKKSKHSVRAFSAYMTEFTSFNALDPDEYGPEIVEVGNVDLEIPVKSND
jgi:hypothetical protein